MNGHIAHRRILHPDIPSKPSRIPYIEIMHIGLLAAATLSATTLLGQPAPSWRDQGILYLKNSPHAKLRNIPWVDFAQTAVSPSSVVAVV